MGLVVGLVVGVVGVSLLPSPWLATGGIMRMMLPVGEFSRTKTVSKTWNPSHMLRRRLVLLVLEVLVVWRRGWWLCFF